MSNNCSHDIPYHLSTIIILEFERLRAEKLAAERNNNPAPPPAPLSVSSQKKKKKKKPSSKTEQNNAAASMHMPPIISDPNKKKVGGVDENGDLVLTDSHGFSGRILWGNHTSLMYLNVMSNLFIFDSFDFWL